MCEKPLCYDVDLAETEQLVHAESLMSYDVKLNQLFRLGWIWEKSSAFKQQSPGKSVQNSGIFVPLDLFFFKRVKQYSL